MVQNEEAKRGRKGVSLESRQMEGQDGVAAKHLTFQRAATVLRWPRRDSGGRGLFPSSRGRR